MRLPERMPLPTYRSEPISAGLETHTSDEKAIGLSPAACCAEACVNVPIVGRVCHCVLDLPVCP
jgi:hypothetical protein